MATSSGGVPVVKHGTSVDLSYNAAGGASVRAGPFAVSIVRVVVPPGGTSVRIEHGNSSVTATPTNCPEFLCGLVEHIEITPGDYIACISSDATTGHINITAC